MAMNRSLKLLFFLVVRVLVLMLIGLNIQHRQRLPSSGPAILVANHNSHLDTLVLMSLFPLAKLHLLRPVADEEYFLKKNRYLSWFSQQVLNIIPVCRETKGGDSQKEGCTHRKFLSRCASALTQNNILILYPEGTRGEPESLAEFNSGIAHLSKLHPDVPIVPIFLHGLGKALPKGEFLLVPFFCQVVIGTSFCWTGKKQTFLQNLMEQMRSLAMDENLPALPRL
jgi:1-acyl-sn-glycerol-3-phosphate acyltransferase